MPEIIVDEALRARLHGLSEELTLCDQTGKVLGYFMPVTQVEVSDEDDEIIVRPEDQCPYTPEELKQMRKQTGGISLKEFWKKMGRA